MDQSYFQNYTNKALLGELVRTVRQERSQQATLLLILGEVERRRLYAVEGYSSLYKYAVEALGLSEDSALMRIRASRVANRYPVVIAWLRAGEVSLSVLLRLYPHVKHGDCSELLQQARGKSVRQVEAILGSRFPKAPQPDHVRSIDEDQVRFSFQADQQFKEEFEALQSRLRHKYPKGKLREIFGESLRALKERLDKEVESTRNTKKAQTTKTRYIPKAVRQAVWERDGGCCAYVSPSGKRCGEKNFLEFDHKVAWSQGGGNVASNLRLLCRTHNRMMADRMFGSAFIEQAIEKRKLSQLERYELQTSAWIEGFQLHKIPGMTTNSGSSPHSLPTPTSGN